MKIYYQNKCTKNNCTRNSGKGRLLFLGFLVDDQRASQPGPCHLHQVCLSLSTIPPAICCNASDEDIYFQAFVMLLPLPKMKSCSFLNEWLQCYFLSEAFPSISTHHTSTPGWINHLVTCFTLDLCSQSTSYLLLWYSVCLAVYTLSHWRQGPCLMKQ